ncbi:MAG: hypothetical protein ABIO70_27035 [Pseudomonadota bacterium]
MTPPSKVFHLLRDGDVEIHAAVDLLDAAAPPGEPVSLDDAPPGTRGRLTWPAQESTLTLWRPPNGLPLEGLAEALEALREPGEATTAVMLEPVVEVAPAILAIRSLLANPLATPAGAPLERLSLYLGGRPAADDCLVALALALTFGEIVQTGGSRAVLGEHLAVSATVRGQRLGAVPLDLELDPEGEARWLEWSIAGDTWHLDLAARELSLDSGGSRWCGTVGGAEAALTTARSWLFQAGERRRARQRVADWPAGEGTLNERLTAAMPLVEAPALLTHALLDGARQFCRAVTALRARGADSTALWHLLGATAGTPPGAFASIRLADHYHRLQKTHWIGGPALRDALAGSRRADTRLVGAWAARGTGQLARAEALLRDVDPGDPLAGVAQRCLDRLQADADAGSAPVARERHGEVVYLPPVHPAALVDDRAWSTPHLAEARHPGYQAAMGPPGWELVMRAPSATIHIGGSPCAVAIRVEPDKGWLQVELVATPEAPLPRAGWEPAGCVDAATKRSSGYRAPDLRWRTRRGASPGDNTRRIDLSGALAWELCLIMGGSTLVIPVLP